MGAAAGAGAFGDEAPLLPPNSPPNSPPPDFSSFFGVAAAGLEATTGALFLGAAAGNLRAGLGAVRGGVVEDRDDG